MRVKQGKTYNTFWLFLVILFFIPAMADCFPKITTPSLSYTETVGPGAANITEVIKVQCIATDDASLDLNPPAPYADLSPLGGSAITLMTKASGNLYECTYTLTEGTINAVPTSVNISAINVNGESTSATTNSILIDNAMPSAPGGAIFRKNGAVSTGPILQGDKFGFEITDVRFQSTPTNTTCNANLSAIGLSATTPIPNVGGGVFRLDNITAPANIDLTTDFTLTLTDPYTQWKEFKTNSIVFDTVLPIFNSASVQILSGNSTARPGDTIRISAALAAADGDTVTASQSDLLNSNPPLNPPTNMNLSGTNWTLDVTLPKQILKNSSLPIDLLAVDNAGNKATRRVYVPVDLDPPDFSYPSVTIFSPDKRTQFGTLASSTDQLRFVATITNNITDNLTVSVNLTSIGGLASTQMPLVSNFGNQEAHEGWFQIPVGILENTSAPFSFTVTAIDQAGNVVYQLTTPPIYIDNLPPTISGAQVIRTGGGSDVKIGDQITITCQVANIDSYELPWVDLRRIGGLASSTLNDLGGGTYAATFTVQAPVSGFQPLDETYAFTIICFDDAYNKAQANTTQLNYDNEPPVIASITWSVNPPLSATHQWVKVGDSLTLKVGLALTSKGVMDGETVSANLTSVGGALNQIFAYDGIGTFSYTFAVATGTVNGGALFPVAVKDDMLNVTLSQISIANFDNDPPKPGAMTLTKVDSGVLPGVVKIGDSLNFQIPLTLDVPDDHANAIIDLSHVGGTQTAVMDYSGSGYSLNFVATPSLINNESTNYSFRADVYDQAGNMVSVFNGPHTVDCWPPKIIALAVDSTKVVIGKSFGIHIQTSEEGGGNPYADLSSIGRSTTEYFQASGTAHGWDLNISIGTGTLNNVPTFFNVYLKDSAGNVAATTTPVITIDNTPPQVSGNLTVSWNDSPPDGKIKAGDLVTFGITVTDPSDNIGSATIDLSAIGRSSTTPMVYNGSGFTVTTSAALTTAEFSNYVFNATLSDSNGNKLFVTSDPILAIDCLSPKISNSGIVISQTNGDNPVSTIANSNDVITVYSTLTDASDAGATATININGTDVAFASMTYSSSKNRYEGNFIVPSGGGAWGNLIRTNLQYTVTAQDDAGNIATPASGLSAFLVSNTPPTISSVVWNLNPDLPDPSPVINVGSGSPVDLLWVNASLANNEPVSSAFLNLSQFTGAPASYPLTVSGNSVYTSSGISFSKYGITDAVDASFSLTIYDQAGNSVIATQTFRIDTKRPTITQANFNGTVCSVVLHEAIRELDISRWQVWGSDTAGLATYTTFNPGDSLNVWFDSFDWSFSLDHQKIISQWASTPLSLHVDALNSAPVKDLSGNWGTGYQAYPVLITDSSWREPPQISIFSVSEKWPQAPSVTIDLVFNKQMDPSTLVGSNAVLLYKPIGYDFLTVDYSAGYIFQPFDTFTWIDSSRLRIALCEEGATWVAKKLGSGTTPLYFATRTSSAAFVKDLIGKPMKSIQTSAPISATLTRPYTGNTQPPFGYYIESATLKPQLDLGSGILRLTTSDRTLLYNNDFRTLDSVLPQIGMPIPTTSQAFANFHNRIEVHDLDRNVYKTLLLDPLALDLNSEMSSTTISLKLSSSDIQNVLALFSANLTPTWGLKVYSGAFQNWWGQPNMAYLPSDHPGDLTILSTLTPVASLAACSISDFPPVKDSSSGNLIFEFEINPPLVNLAPVPISSATPTARIYKSDDETSSIIIGAFKGWSTRKVDGNSRWVARFVNQASFPAELTLLSSFTARMEISNVTDIFGTVMPTVSSNYVYDLAAKNDSAAGGFNTASTSLVIDLQPPTLVSISPLANIGVTQINAANYTAIFSENMDITSIPSMTIATTGYSIPCKFLGWQSDGRSAGFTNSVAITDNFPNGAWTINVSLAKDLAGNTMTTAALQIEIRTRPPEVQSIFINTIQTTVSTNVLTDQPLSLKVPPAWATFNINYLNRPTRDLPHNLMIYDSNMNFLGSSQIVLLGGTSAVATFTQSSFVAQPGPDYSTINVRVKDQAGNETVNLKSWLIDNVSPTLTNFDISGIATVTSGVSWYSPAVQGQAVATIKVYNSSDTLRLTGYPLAGGATLTWPMSGNGVNGWSTSFGSELSEGLYAFSAVDQAGNPALGVASKTVKVDITAPTVVSISPDTAVGANEIGKVTFKVVYSERMDPGVVPTLQLATSSPVSAIIPMNFTGWTSTDNATTAVFVNAVSIDGTFPVGYYQYVSAGGCDLARNPQTQSTTFSVKVQAQGPIADLTILTTQPAIYDGVVQGLPFSPLVSAGGSATLRLTYASDPEHTPHWLIVLDSNLQTVATLPVPVANPADVVFPNVTSVWQSGKYPRSNSGPVQYSFQLSDHLGNISPIQLGPLVYDSKPPVVSSFKFDDGGHGLVVGGIKYYSPTFGPASMTAVTDATDTLNLIISSGTFPVQKFQLTQYDTVYSGKFGDQLGDCLATFSIADLAGNLGVGANSSILVKVDRTPPNVVSASPSAPIGIIPFQQGLFQISFDEDMNPAVSPTVTLSTGPYVISLAPIQDYPHGWISSRTCVLTNQSAILNFPISTFTYNISNALDLAGNKNATSQNFNLWINSQQPAYSATLKTLQPKISSSTWLVNQPISPIVDPGYGFLSVSYVSGPYGIPHQVLVFDPDANQVATLPLNPVGKNGTATVNLGFFGMTTPAPIQGPTAFSMKIQDTQGNIAPSPLKIIYDTVAPSIFGFDLSGYSTATTSAAYYNPAKGSNLSLTLQTDSTDQLKIALGGTNSTSTVLLIRSGTTHYATLSPAFFSDSAFPDGTYLMTPIDLAGNIAVGPGVSKTLIIDRKPPQINDVTFEPAGAWRTLATGQAAITVTFNKRMDLLASATPSVYLATQSSSVSFKFVSWINDWQARFVNETPITNNIPQGEWGVNVTAFDLTDNKVSVVFPKPVVIKSRGLKIAKFEASSYQLTTSDKIFPQGVLKNQPFSNQVWPNAATLSITLSETPESGALPAKIVFFQNGVESVLWNLDFSNTLGTFTWNQNQGPMVVTPTLFSVRVKDNFGNYSLESFDWKADPQPPVVSLRSITGGNYNSGEDATYFSRGIQGSVTGLFTVGGEDSPPVIRYRSGIATGTIIVTPAGGGAVSGVFSGYDSAKNQLPDGTYYLDVVDNAGNIGIPEPGKKSYAVIVMDNTPPKLNSVTLSSNGVATNRFAPSAGSLDIAFDTPEQLSTTGIYYVEIRTDTNVLVTRLQAKLSNGTIGASWDGTKTDGSKVLEGSYKVYASDFSGNRSVESANVFAVTSVFKVTGISQVDSKTIDLVFSNSIDPNSVGNAVISFVPTGPSPVSQDLPASNRLRVICDQSFTNGTSYTVSIDAGSVKSTDGVPLNNGSNSASFLADTKGPVLTKVAFDDTIGAREFVAFFDERVNSQSAANTSSYKLLLGNSQISLNNAVLRPDQSSVLITSANDLLATNVYSIVALSVTDVIGNLCDPLLASASFSGRDLTPPVLSLAVFSNPANENDVMMAVVSSKDLVAPPTAEITLGSSAPNKVTMIQGSSPRTYMVGISLSSDSSGFVSIKVSATDKAGNIGTSVTSFTTATVSASVKLSAKSPDGFFSASFEAGALKAGARVSILPQTFDTSVISQSQRASTRVFSKMFSAKENNLTNSNSVKTSANQNEFIPMNNAYEIKISQGKLAKMYQIQLQLPTSRAVGAPEASVRNSAGGWSKNSKNHSTNISEKHFLNGNVRTSAVPDVQAANSGNHAANCGLCLLNSDDTWQWLAPVSQSGEAKCLAYSGCTVAILKDVVPPKVTMADSSNCVEKKVFQTERPKFSGKVSDCGSGFDSGKIFAVIDGQDQQISGVNEKGEFDFIPAAPLTAGDHELFLRASDLAGNQTVSAKLSFSVQTSLTLGEVLAYPNPAKNRSVLRITANRSDLDNDFIKLQVYDITGHSVRELDFGNMSRENSANGGRFIYEFPWDLKNEDGKKVSNGIYLAKVTITDPENSGKRVKKTCKIAVLK
ncbi:MAG: Ig-like domain-containing protein [Candidatus Riflebacteria bacterium]|nr:Ig-like domain-containing protein [Candidatus Riflebacteria bacterium]